MTMKTIRRRVSAMAHAKGVFLGLSLGIPLLATSPAAAYSCTYTGNIGVVGSTTYHDNTLYENFEENIDDNLPGYSASDFYSEVFFVVNGGHPLNKTIKDVQLLLFCDDNLIARTVRGPNIPVSDAAKFNIPFPLVGGNDAPCSTARLQTEVRWVNGGSYKRKSDSYDLSRTDGTHNGIDIEINAIGLVNYRTFEVCN